MYSICPCPCSIINYIALYYTPSPSHRIPYTICFRHMYHIPCSTTYHIATYHILYDYMVDFMPYTTYHIPYTTCHMSYTILHHISDTRFTRYSDTKYQIPDTRYHVPCLTMPYNTIFESPRSNYSSACHLLAQELISFAA